MTEKNERFPRKRYYTYILNQFQISILHKFANRRSAIDKNMQSLTILVIYQNQFQTFIGYLIVFLNWILSHSFQAVVKINVNIMKLNNSKTK